MKGGTAVSHGRTNSESNERPPLYTYKHNMQSERRAPTPHIGNARGTPSRADQTTHARSAGRAWGRRSPGETYTDRSYHGKTTKHGSACLLGKGEAVLSRCEGRQGIYRSKLLAIVQVSDQLPVGDVLRVDSKGAIKAILSTKVGVRCKQLVEEAGQSILAKAQRLKHVKAHVSSTGNNNVDALANRACDPPSPQSHMGHSPHETSLMEGHGNTPHTRQGRSQ